MAAYPPGMQNPAWGGQASPMRQQPQPMPQQYYNNVAQTQSRPPNSVPWTTDIFSCFDDCGTCACAWFLPCVLVGRIAEIVDEGRTSCLTAGCIYYCLQSCTGCGCLYTYSFRTRLRNKYGLELKPCDDCCTDCWCLPCSLSQQIRELQNRGIDPSLGWEANRAAYLQAPQPPKMQY
jgi:Cys-rich protein (TIGR01571 family)